MEEKGEKERVYLDNVEVATSGSTKGSGKSGSRRPSSEGRRPSSDGRRPSTEGRSGRRPSAEGRDSSASASDKLPSSPRANPVHGTEIDESSTTHASNALPVATQDGGEGDEDAASDGSGSAYGMDMDVYDTLLPLPADRKHMTYKQIGWHITNYIIPLHEIESYPLELSGMLGDLGLYIPIVVLLALNKQIDLGSTLVTTGLCNIITGLVFKVPMCVQPMKSIATVALTNALTEGEIMAAGICTSAAVMMLGITNLITVVDYCIPRPVVRGLQLGLGLAMFTKALDLMPEKAPAFTWSHDAWMEWDGYFIAVITLIFCLITARSKRIPAAFVVFMTGVVIGALRMSSKGQTFDMGIATLHAVTPTKSEWAGGFIKGAIPQIPTTLLNSCIAVCKLSDVLYPTRKTNMNLRTVSSSVGTMNLTFCWLGGFPMCHGSGGLAGQHRFGARTNLSIIVLGFCKLFLGIFFGKGLLGLLVLFPKGLLAALLAVASWELSVSGREGLKGSLDEARLCVLTTACVTFCGQAVGIILGLVLAYMIYASEMYFGSAEQTESAVQRWADNKLFFRKLMRQWKVWWVTLYDAPYDTLRGNNAEQITKEGLQACSDLVPDSQGEQKHNVLSTSEKEMDKAASNNKQL